MGSPGKNIGVGYHALIQGNLSDPGIEPTSPALQEGSLPLSHWGSPIICYAMLCYAMLSHFSRVRLRATP